MKRISFVGGGIASHSTQYSLLKYVSVESFRFDEYAVDDHDRDLRNRVPWLWKISVSPGFTLMHRRSLTHEP